MTTEPTVADPAPADPAPVPLLARLLVPAWLALLTGLFVWQFHHEFGKIGSRLANLLGL